MTLSVHTSASIDFAQRKAAGICSVRVQMESGTPVEEDHIRLVSERLAVCGLHLPILQG